MSCTRSGLLSCNLIMFTIILRALFSLTARARFQKSPSLMLAYELHVLFSVSRSLIKRRRQFVNKWGGILKSLCKSLLFKGDRWFLKLLKATIFNQCKIKWWFWVVKPQAWWQKVVEWGATKFSLHHNGVSILTLGHCPSPPAHSLFSC